MKPINEDLLDTADNSFRGDTGGVLIEATVHSSNWPVDSSNGSWPWWQTNLLTPWPLPELFRQQRQHRLRVCLISELDAAESKLQ